MNVIPDDPCSDLALRHPALGETSREQLFDALADSIRRQVLADLDTEDGPVSLSTLAERVANPRDRDRSETGTESDGTDSRSLERVTALLHHVHLPKLDECGLVDYDHREKTVRANTSP